MCLIVGNNSCPDAAGKGSPLSPKPEGHKSGGPLGFVKARAGDLADAAKATGGFVGDVGVGAYDSVKGTLTLGWELSPTRALIDPDGFAKDARKFGQASWYGITHPAELGKALVDWNDLTGGHPGKALGQWLPEIVIAVFTSGMGTAAEGGAEAARDLSRVEKAAEAARAAEAENEFANLASKGRTTHILEGDATGGGHQWPGLSSKTPFPKDWSGARIMHEISDIATDPRAWENAIPHGSRTVLTGVRDGVEIRVIVDSQTGEIISAYPMTLPRNP